MAELLLHYQDLTNASRTCTDLGEPLLSNLVSDPDSGDATCVYALAQFHTRAFALCASLHRLGDACLEVQKEVQTLDENLVRTHPTSILLQPPVFNYPTVPPYTPLPPDPTTPPPPAGTGYVLPDIGGTTGTLNLPPDLKPTQGSTAPIDGPKVDFPTPHTGPTR